MNFDPPTIAPPVPMENERRFSFSARRIGTAHSLCLLEFKDGNDVFQYLDKDGDLTFDKCKEKLGDQLRFNAYEWSADKLTTNSNKFEAIFSSGVYVYFPTGRSELPHWLNSENREITQKFGLKRKFRYYLDRTFVVDSAAQESKQWLLDVLLDRHLYGETVTLENANQIIRAILQHPKVRFGVGSRKSGHRVAVFNRSKSGLLKVLLHVSTRGEPHI
jgi:hypothetical protein